MGLCKEALTKSDGDMAKAIEYINERSDVISRLRNLTGAKIGLCKLAYDEAEKDFEKAGFTSSNPFQELNISESIQLVPAPLSSLTKESLSGFDFDLKTVSRSKNMFALGLVCFLFNRPIDQAIHFLENKFKKKADILKANIKVLVDG